MLTPLAPISSVCALRLLVALVLEGELDLRAVRADLTVFDLEVQLRHLRDAQIPERRRRPGDRGGRRLLPRFGAGPDQLDDLVDALRHGAPPTRDPRPTLAGREPTVERLTWHREGGHGS